MPDRNSAREKIRSAKLKPAVKILLADVLYTDRRGHARLRLSPKQLERLNGIANALNAQPSELLSAALEAINDLAPNAGAKNTKRTQAAFIGSPAEIIRYSESIIVALQEIVERRQPRHHNLPP